MNRKRQKRNHSILFENLPNEVFSQIFSYLNGVDTLFAFLQLNHHFQCLTNEYCRIFDFKSVMKRKFDFVFRNSDTKQWKSLQLSDDNNITSGEIEYFSEFYLQRKRFSQLESFSILGMELANMSAILLHLPSLTNLVSLTMKPVCGRRIPKFELPRLKNLIISSCKNTDWLKNFPQLQNLEYTLTYCCSTKTFLRWPSTLKRLKIIFENGECSELIYQSFRKLLQLNTLEIHQIASRRSSTNGQIWKQLIRSSFPLLKNLRFYFRFSYGSFSSDKLEEIVASFSTSFYAYEKKWFTCCDLYIGYQPKHFFSLRISLKPLTILTKPFDESLSILSNNNSSISKPNVINLVIANPLGSIKSTPILTKLRHLELQHGARMSLETFSLLLDRLPYLDSLTVEKSVLRTLTDNGKHVRICNDLSYKIRSLNLHSTSNIPGSMSRYELYEILRPFTIRCEYLSLNISLSDETIAFVLQIFRQLQSLHVLVTEEDRSKMNIQWL